MPYPPNLASGVDNEGSWLPTELYAGESDIVTDRGQCGATAIAILQIVARAEDGLIVPYDGVLGLANKAGTFSSTGTEGDTITINGQVFTARATPVAPTDFRIGADANATATNFNTVLNLPANYDLTNVRASRTGAVVTVFAMTPGVGGNSIPITKTSTAFTWAGGATTLSGGSDQTEGRAIGIAAQAATPGEWLPFFTGGVFNHEVLVWPAPFDTLAKRQAVFDRTNLQVSRLLGAPGPMVLP